MARTRGYWIAHIDVDDVALYREFTESVSETIARHGGRFLVRGGSAGSRRGDRARATPSWSFRPTRTRWRVTNPSPSRTTARRG